jgi:hypothetical protein
MKTYTLTKEDVKLIQTFAAGKRGFYAKLFNLPGLFHYEDLVGKEITASQFIAVRKSVEDPVKIIVGVNLPFKKKKKKLSRSKRGKIRLTENDVRVLEETTTTFSAQKRLCTLLGRAFPLEWKHCIGMYIAPEKYNQLGLQQIKDQASPF